MTLYWSMRAAFALLLLAQIGTMEPISAVNVPSTGHDSAELLWWNMMGKGGHDRALDMAVSPAGVDSSPELFGGSALYIVGMYRGHFHISDTLQLAPQGSRDGYLLKVSNTTGKVIWGRTLGGVGDDIVEAVAYSPAHGIFEAGVIAVGSFRAPLTLGEGMHAVHLQLPADPFCSGYCYGMMIARYKINGDLDWAVAGAGKSHDLGAAVVIQSSQIWIAGAAMSSSVAFSNGGVGGGVGYTTPNVMNSLLVRLDLDNGGVLWKQAMTGYGSRDTLRSLTLVPSDATLCADCIIASGMFESILGGIRPTLIGWDATAISLTSRGEQDVYVVAIQQSRYSSTPSMKWAVQVGGAGNEWQSSSGLTAYVSDRAGEGVVVGCEFRSQPVTITRHVGYTRREVKSLSSRGQRDGLLFRLDTEAGELRWTLHIGGSGEDVIYSVAANPSSLPGFTDIWVSGASLSASLLIEGVTLHMLEWDSFLLKVDAGTGAVLMATTVSSSASTKLDALAVVASGHLAFAATHSGEAVALGRAAGGGTPNAFRGTVHLAANATGSQELLLGVLDVSTSLDCLTTAWSTWGACNRACDGGNSTRTRRVARPAAAGGAACPAELVQVLACNQAPCKECAMPALHSHVLPECSSTTDTSPITCQIGCDGPTSGDQALQLVRGVQREDVPQGERSSTCDRVTGVWSGADVSAMRCLLPPPQLEVIRAEEPALVRVSASGLADYIVVYSHVSADSWAQLQPSCSRNASALVGDEEVKVEVMPAGQGSLQIYITTPVLAVACSNASSEAGRPAEEVVEVVSRPPNVILRGSNPVHVTVLPPAPASSSSLYPHSWGVVAESCDCFLPSVSCKYYSSAAAYTGIFFTSQSLSVRSCHEDGLMLQSSQGNMVIRVPSLTSQDTYQPSSLARLRLTLRGGAGVGEAEVRQHLLPDIAEAMLLVAARVTTRVSATPLAWDTRRLRLESVTRVDTNSTSPTSNATGSWGVQATVLLLPDPASGSSSTRVSAWGLAGRLYKALATGDAWIHASSRVLHAAVQFNEPGSAAAVHATSLASLGQLHMPSGEEWSAVLARECSGLVVEGTSCESSSSQPSQPSGDDPPPQALPAGDGEQGGAWLVWVVVIGCAVVVVAAVMVARAKLCGRDVAVSPFQAADEDAAAFNRAVTQSSSRYAYTVPATAAVAVPVAQPPERPRPKPAAKRELSRADSVEDGSTCVVCMSEQVTTMTMPCQHLCMCAACSTHPTVTSCPLCRAPIEGRVMFSWATGGTTTTGSA